MGPYIVMTGMYSFDINGSSRSMKQTTPVRIDLRYFTYVRQKTSINGEVLYKQSLDWQLRACQS